MYEGTVMTKKLTLKNKESPKHKETANETIIIDESTKKLMAVIGRKRFIITGKNKILKTHKKRAELFEWAVSNGFSAVILPPDCPAGIAEEAHSKGLIPETGGRIMSLLVPRRHFIFHSDYFRMEGGRRRKKTHFCPTNPDTIAALRNEVKKKFSAAGSVTVFHIWPDTGGEKTWCSCPACRAFTHAEQYRMAVNAAADALAEIIPASYISCHETHDEEPDISLRSNIFRINPDEVTTPAISM